MRGSTKGVCWRCTWAVEWVIGVATWAASSWVWRSWRRTVHQQSADLVHSCIIFLLVRVELVVEVVSCTLPRESQVGGEVVDAVVHCLLLLMQRSFCTEEVALGDVWWHVVVLLDEDCVGRSTWPFHHSKQNVSGRKRRTYTNVPWPMLTMNQVHSNADNEIALLVPILVGSHTYTSKSYSGARWG